VFGDIVDTFDSETSITSDGRHGSDAQWQHSDLAAFSPSALSELIDGRWASEYLGKSLE
jgi:hypothetical protein